MKIIKSTEPITVAHPIFCIFGQPGICKTSLGYSAKEPFLLDFDEGCYRAVNRRDTGPVVAWQDIADLKDTLAPYSTVIVDTVGRCLDLMTVDIIENNPKAGRDGTLSLQGYGILKTRFRTWMAQLKAMGKDIVLIAHQREDKDGDSTVMRPDIIGASAGEVMKISDFVGYVYMNGRERLLDFNPTNQWFGKNPAQWKALKIPPPEKCQAFLGDLMDKGRAALGAISEDSSKVMVLVDDWRAAIETFTSTDELNGALPKIVAITGIAAPQCKKLLMDRAKTLKFSYDTEIKGFVGQLQAKAS